MADFQELKDLITAKIYPNGRQEITGGVLQNILLTMVDDLGEHAGGSAVNGFIVVDDIADLPDPGQVGIGYLVETRMYLYVGEGGDTLSGKYKDVGEFKGPPGKQGNDGVGFSTVSSQEDGTIVITLTSGDSITVDLNHSHSLYCSKVAESSVPAGGLLPDVVYNLGVISESTSFTLASPVEGNTNHYFWMFNTGSTAPAITWPAGLTWVGGSAPVVSASKHYEISVLNGIAVYLEV